MAISSGARTQNLEKISVPCGDVISPLLLVLVVLRRRRVILQKNSHIYIIRPQNIKENLDFQEIVTL